MAQKATITLIDDLDGSAAEETVTFALDGVTYEIDLTATHAGQLRQALATYTEHGRRVSGTRARRPQRSEAQRDYDPAAVRAWASSNAVSVPARGRIPKAIVAQFHAAGN